MIATYPNTSLYINGEWKQAKARETLNVVNPATEEVIGQVAHARQVDLDEALESANSGFNLWKQKTPLYRYKIMRKAADLLRERSERIAVILTTEQGKPLQESKLEALIGADRIDWMAEEGRRTYGRVIPSRTDGIHQFTIKEPVGPVAAFTPWNFPINQILQKIPAAISAGCSVILKGPEEAPASCAEVVKVFEDAGLPEGVLNLVFGIPSEISDYLISHPIIQKITFTGSTEVGKKLAAKAGEYMKLSTMELGGHAPAIVFQDADIDVAVKLLAGSKYRNAGQVCVAPTRLLVHASLYDEFVDNFVKTTRRLKVGNGLIPDISMGPLAHERRIKAVEEFVNDAVSKGAEINTGGSRFEEKGYFFEPTVLTNVSLDSRIMNEEPFGPVAPISQFCDFEEVVEEANRLPYGLAAYAYTKSTKIASAIGSALRVGIVGINNHGVAMPETPFGGTRDSGYGREGGSEGIDAYLYSKFITQSDV